MAQALKLYTLKDLIASENVKYVTELAIFRCHVIDLTALETHHVNCRVDFRQKCFIFPVYEKKSL